MNRPRKEIRASLPITKAPDNANDSGSFLALPEMFEPIVPLLKLSVKHMRESNVFVRDNNRDLHLIRKSLTRLILVGSLAVLFLLVGTGLLLLEQRRLQQQLNTQLDKQEETNNHLALVSQKLRKTYDVTKETKDAVEARPKLEVKPADTSDPRSRPSLVVRMPPVKVMPSEPVSIEIPLEKKK